MAMTKVEGKNVEFSVEKNVLTIKVDITKELGPSQSGKTILIASTGGAMNIPGTEAKLNFQVYKKPSAGK